MCRNLFNCLAAGLKEARVPPGVYCNTSRAGSEIASLPGCPQRGVGWLAEVHLL